MKSTSALILTAILLTATLGLIAPAHSQEQEMNSNNTQAQTAREQIENTTQPQGCFRGRC